MKKKVHKQYRGWTGYVICLSNYDECRWSTLKWKNVTCKKCLKARKKK